MTAAALDGPRTLGVYIIDAEEEPVAARRTPEKPPVGLPEVAAMFGVSAKTPVRWGYRSRLGEMPVPFPEPDFTISRGVPGWYRSTIDRWAQESGRPIVAEPQYVRRAGAEDAVDSAEETPEGALVTAGS